ncbi:MAG: transposase family protein [Limisphaerales bacterium]
MTDPRDPRGVRHKLAGFLALIALAVTAGCKGPHAIAEFARSLNPAQRGRLRCRPRRGRPREYDVPSERTSHSGPPASKVAVRMTAPPHHPHVDALAWFVSPLLAGYFPP